MYANQAVLLDIYYFLYCSMTSDPLAEVTNGTHHYFQWSHNFWLQGPRSTKGFNSTVDIQRFKALLLAAADRVSAARAEDRGSCSR